MSYAEEIAFDSATIIEFYLHRSLFCTLKLSYEMILRVHNKHGRQQNIDLHGVNETVSTAANVFRTPR